MEQVSISVGRITIPRIRESMQERLNSIRMPVEIANLIWFPNIVSYRQAYDSVLLKSEEFFYENVEA